MGCLISRKSDMPEPRGLREHTAKHSNAVSLTTPQGLELGEGVDDEGVALWDISARLDGLYDDSQVGEVQIGLLGQIQQQVEV